VAGLEDSNMIDVVALDRDGNCLVVMVETRTWSGGSEQREQLKSKVNTYAAYILDGTLNRQYPETIGQPVYIRLDCPEEPTDDIAAIVDWAARQLRDWNIGFLVKIMK